MTTDGLRVELYLKNADGKSGINGLFTRGGLNGMPDGADMRIIHTSSPFCGALMDQVIDQT